MIEVKNLCKVYSSTKGTVKALDNVSLTINAGEIFGIIGRSGAGKSSLLRCLNQLEIPTSGQIVVDNTDITALSKKALRHKRQEIGMIFQHFYLLSAKTDFQNVAFALKAAGKKKSEIEQRVPQLLEMVGLQDKSNYYPAQLSGGQKQRVGIARALANEPKVLLCDEATSALDPETTRSILQLLREINQQLKITIVLITHEMEVIKEICHRVAVMQDGQIIESGLVYDLFASPKQALTKSFITSVLDFQLPEQFNHERLGTLVQIQFQGERAEEGVVSAMLKSYDVQANILHGQIEYIQGIPLGIFMMELTGEPEEVARALAYIRQRTAGVEVLRDVA